MRMDTDLSNLARIFQAQMRPGLTAIGRPVDSIAVRDIAANRCLAHANIDHIGIRFGDSDSANRSSFEESIRDVLPVLTTVGGLPDTSTSGAEVEYLWVDWIDCCSYHPTTSKTTGCAPLKRAQDP